MRNGATRILIYCQDSLGLGHLRRNVHIAGRIRALDPDATILFVADSPLAPFFEPPLNSDVVKLPTLVKVRQGDWEVPRLPEVPPEKMLKIRAHLIREVAQSFEPDLMLVDHMPHGANGELIPALEWLRSHRPGFRCALGLRDILGAPEDIIPKWTEFGGYALMEEHYHAVLVYGSRDIYDVGRAYAFPSAVQPKLRYCGYVTAPLEGAPESSDLQSRFDAVRAHSVLVMGGGGSDAHGFMDTVIEAVRELGPEVPFNTYLVTGPFMPSEQRHALEGKAQGLPVRVRRFREDTARLLCSADLVVAMAGYNTTCEVLALARRALLVPRAGPSAEQTTRTRLLHERGLLHAIHPRDLTPESLGRAMLEQLARAPRLHGEGGVDLNGASRAAAALLALVEETRPRSERRAWAERTLSEGGS